MFLFKTVELIFVADVLGYSSNCKQSFIEGQEKASLSPVVAGPLLVVDKTLSCNV